MPVACLYLAASNMMPLSSNSASVLKCCGAEVFTRKDMAPAEGILLHYVTGLDTGATYELSFWLAKPGANVVEALYVYVSPPPAIYTVSDKKGAGPPLTMNDNPPGIRGSDATFPWTQYRVQFAPTQNTAEVGLAYQSDAGPLFIDDVSLQPLTPCSKDSECTSPDQFCRDGWCRACSDYSHW